MKRCVPLESAAESVCNQSSVPPLIFQMPPEQGRRVLEEMQDTPVYKYPADISSVCVNTGMWGRIPVYFIVPRGEKIRNIIFYIHGAGWVFGSFHTHEKLVRELSARTDSLVVFPEYSRSPEAKYPTAIEQCYFILSHIWEIIEDCFPMENGAALTVAGDSVGGNMAIAMALMSFMRYGPCIHKLLLYYPVTFCKGLFNQVHRKFTFQGKKIEPKIYFQDSRLDILSITFLSNLINDSRIELSL